MVRHGLVIALILLLAACGAPPAAEDGVPWTSESNGRPEVQTTPAPVAPTTDERLPDRVVPDRLAPDEGIAPSFSKPPGLPPPRTLPVQSAPSPAPNFSPGLPPGPITNYGTGGMQAIPGAPPNPPYPAGGLMQ